MKNKYEYVIGFTFEGGNGSFEATSETKIKSFKDIKKIKEKLEQENNISNVAISNIDLIYSREHNRKFIK